MRDYEYLIHLLYCFINNETPAEKPDGVSFENVYLIGKAHEVANIAFLSVEKLKNKPDEALYDEWKTAYYFSVERDMKQTLDRELVVSSLHENGIRTLEAQGTVTKKLYPEAYLRMMTDIDLVVDAEKLGDAMKVIENLGYTVTQPQEYDCFAVKDGATELDVHTDFFTEYMFNRREPYHDAVNSPFEHCVSEDGMTCYLSDEYFYLFTVLHTVKHFETAGCGIRRILDLYYLKKAFENKISFDFINKVIDENGFRENVDKLFALEAFWFENEKPQLDLSEAVKDVVTSGNHGNLDIFTRNNVRKDVESGKRFPKLSRIVSFIFPNKEYVYEGYPVCKERGYSTVTCWFYRIFATIKKFRFSHAISYIKRVMKTK